MIFINHEMVAPKNSALLLDSEQVEGLGSIATSRISPPHTVNSLKRAICTVEQISDHNAYEFYQGATEAEPLDEMQRLVFVSGEYPGADATAPAVLVKNPPESELSRNRSAVNTTARVVCGQGALPLVKGFKD